MQMPDSPAKVSGCQKLGDPTLGTVVDRMCFGWQGQIAATLPPELMTQVEDRGRFLPIMPSRKD
jgi:hypothetical protein